jgi:hypothetical protein
MFMPEKTAFCYTLLEKYGLEELHRQSLEGLRRKLRTYANAGLLYY